WRNCEVIRKVVVRQPKPVIEPPTIGIPESAVDAAIEARNEEVDVILEPRQTRHRRAWRNCKTIDKVVVRQPEPAIEPAAIDIPERAVHAAVETRNEEVDVILEPRQRRHQRTCRHLETVSKVRVPESEPMVEPAARAIPEGRIDRGIASDREKVEVA